MLTCPNPPCRKPIPPGARECPRCRADLSLLTTYVEDLHGGLTRAEKLTRAGALGEAVWAYLEVLEVDPDNVSARRQVGQVVAAVRQFDHDSPSRRWFKRLRREARFRQWMSDQLSDRVGWLTTILWVLAILTALVIGYVLGAGSAGPHTPEPPGDEARRGAPSTSAFVSGPTIPLPPSRAATGAPGDALSVGSR